MAVVLLANVRFFGVINVRILGVVKVRLANDLTPTVMTTRAPAGLIK